MGLLIAADILGFALFQLMQVRLGTVDGASTQIVLMLTSFCYMPAVGIAMAGTTLVGQAIGASTRGLGAQGRQRHHFDRRALHGRDRRGPGRRGAVGAAVVYQCCRIRRRAQWWRKAAVLLWIAAGYQLFDGFNIASSACLRGAGDVRASGRHGACAIVVAVRAARAQPVVQAGRRLGRLVAAISAWVRSAGGSPR